MHDPTAVLSLREHLGSDWHAHAVSFPLPAGTELTAGDSALVRDLTSDLSNLSKITVLYSQVEFPLCHRARSG